jgi:hypothetical protein
MKARCAENAAALSEMAVAAKQDAADDYDQNSDDE